MNPHRGKTHILKVWGDLACFTRPEMKVERYSYPIITPSAARGIFDAIYFKKEAGFYWQMEKVEMLAMPRYIALRRNEVKGKISVKKEWIRGDKAPEPLLADGTEDVKGRTQRQTMALKNVCYRIHACMVFRNGEGKNSQACDEQFIRRAKKGKCFYQPYFGCREFPAWFELIEEQAKVAPQVKQQDFLEERMKQLNFFEEKEKQQTAEIEPVKLDLDLGWMLYDVFDLSQANQSDAPAMKSLFHAVLSQGVLNIPEYTSPDVKKEGDL